MKSFFKKILLRPVTICVLSLLITIGGIIATSNMNINLLPDMNLPMIGITIVYPGAGSTTVENDVTNQIYHSLSSTTNVVSIKSYSIDNASVCFIEFDYGIKLSDKINEVRDKLKKIDLPSACEEPVISTIDFNKSAAASISVYRSDNNLKEAYKDAQILSQKFSNINGVGDVKILGVPETKVYLKSIEGLDISLLLIAQALGYEGLNIPFGNINTTEGYVSIVNDGSTSTLQEIENLEIATSLSKTKWDTMESANSYLQLYSFLPYNSLNSIFLGFDNVKNFIDIIDDSNYDNLLIQKNELSLLKNMLSFIETNNVDELNSYKVQFASEEFKLMNEEQMQYLATSNNINYLLLMQIQKMAQNNTIEPFFNSIINFKNTNSNPTNKDYVNLFISLNIFPLDENKNQEEQQSFYETYIDIAQNINYVKFEDILQKKKVNEIILSNDILALLTNTSLFSQQSDSTNLIIINLVRDKNYALFKNQALSLKEDVTKAITNEDLFHLLSNIDTKKAFGFNVSLELISLIRSIDYSEITYQGDTGTALIPIEKLCSIEIRDENEYYSQFNSSLGIVIEVYNKANANTSKTVSKVKEILSTQNIQSATFLLDDQAQFINSSISNVVSSMIIGGSLAIIIIFLFIKKIRTSIIIAITMPLSILSALLVLSIIGISLNMVSLGGLAVGIGMLVDNSIVVIESITKKRTSGLSIYKSAYEGTIEVGGSLLASTLTTICVFFPILFTAGLTKEIFADLSFAVIFSISFSLLIAITVIPTLYCLVYRKQIDLNNLDHNIEELKPSKNKFIKTENLYSKFLSSALKHKLLICLIFLLLFVSSIVMIFTTGTEFLPSIDKGQIEVMISYDSDETLENATNKSLDIYNQIKDNIHNIEHMSVVIGKIGLIGINIEGKISIQLKESNQNTNDTVLKIRELLQNSEKKITVKQIDGVVASITSGINGISISLLSDDETQLEDFKNLIIPKLLNLKGIDNIYDDQSSKSKEYSFKIDRNLCTLYNLNYENIVKMLRVGISGLEMGQIKINDTDYGEIILKFNDNVLLDINSILNINVGTYNNNQIKLNDIVTVQEYEKSKVIYKTNNKYTLTISFETSNIDTGTVTKEIKQEINKYIDEFAGVTFTESGVNSYLSNAFSGLVVSLIAAFILLYAVMCCQFESLVKPLIVIMSIPFALTGGFLALTITNTPLSVVAFIGLIMLMGVIVNNAIVMIDKIEQLIKEGNDPFSSVINGASTRLRAILMTTLTTVLALIPMALGIGNGSELMQPLGIVAIGGLLLGTTVTLILIPAFYCIIKRIKA